MISLRRNGGTVHGGLYCADRNGGSGVRRSLSSRERSSPVFFSTVFASLQPPYRSAAALKGATCRIRIRGSFGIGRVSIVYSAGAMKETTCSPPAPDSCSTGAVIAIFSGSPDSTGAVIAILARPSFSPEI